MATPIGSSISGLRPRRVDHLRGSREDGCVNSPVTPWVLAGRIVAIVGMAFFAAVAILLFIIPEWVLGFAAALMFFPFFGLIVLVERYQSKHGMIGPETELDRAE